MPRLIVVLLLFFFTTPALLTAQNAETAATPIVSSFTVIGRVGISHSPYHIFEGWFTKGDWVLADIGYIGFNNPGEYRELFVGGGRTLVAKNGVVVIEELYLNFATGPKGHGAKYFQPWTYAGYTRGKLHAEGVYVPYIPLNDAATLQHVVERIKVEHVVSSRFKAGAGYGAYQFGDGPWQNKPFITATYTTKNDQSYELWLQHIPKGLQVQVRFQAGF